MAQPLVFELYNMASMPVIEEILGAALNDLSKEEFAYLMEYSENYTCLHTEQALQEANGVLGQDRYIYPGDWPFDFEAIRHTKHAQNYRDYYNTPAAQDERRRRKWLQDHSRREAELRDKLQRGEIDLQEYLRRLSEVLKGKQQ